MLGGELHTASLTGTQVADTVLADTVSTRALGIFSIRATSAGL